MADIAARILIVFAAFAASCSAFRVESPDSRSSSEDLVNILWVPADATIRELNDATTSIRDGRALYSDGSASVGFIVTADHEDLSRNVVAHFERLGWCQRKTQFMNPQMATSFEEGWRHRCACILQLDADGKPIPRGELFEWTGEWENSRGDVAHYSFFAEHDRINGYASITPFHRVRAFHARFGR
jgi:hypothetical protein